jgi:hypothetical protein
MKKWDTAVYRNNNIRLMWYHVGFFVLWLAVALWLAGLRSGEQADAKTLLGLLLFSAPLVLHAVLGYGSLKRMELSRKVSEWVFALLVLAFPIGTFLSIYFFLPATMWEAQEEAT